MTIETLPSTRIHLPGSPEFAAATRLWNGAVTHRPAAVARPTSRSEVQSALRYVADSGLPVAVRGGGHDWAGRALIAGGLVIDLSLMRRVDVDVTSQTAFVSGGSTAADVVAATEPFGLVPATGTYGGVGIVGLTLAGGYGPLNGIAGLALDNVIAFEVVLHDGTATIADERHEPDLFWALRGGGGNFGVVTGMRVRLHALDSVIAGFIGFPWQQAEQILRRYDVLRPTMPDELTVQIGVLSGPDGNPIVFMAPAWSGTAATGVTWIERLQRLGTPVIAQVGQMPYSAMLGLFDPYVIDGRHYELRTRTVRSLGDDVTDTLLRAGESKSSTFSGIAIHHFHGAATRIPLGDTAFGLRSDHMVVEIVAAWDPADEGRHHRDWADTVYSELGPQSLDGGYPNLIGPGQARQADAAYGPNADRLSAVKRRYDPHDVFSATPLPSAA
jgi:FAD/FMN-containing dehydrogenase